MSEGPQRPARLGPVCTRSEKRETQATAIHHSARWRVLAAHTRRIMPVCCDPLGMHRGVSLPSTSTHHIIPIHRAPELAYDPANLATLCERCHNKIDAMEEAGTDTFGFVVIARHSLYPKYLDNLRKENVNPDLLVKISVFTSKLIQNYSPTYVGEGGSNPYSFNTLLTDGHLKENKYDVLPGTLCQRRPDHRVYCAKMKLTRATKCAGCETLK